MKRKCLTTLLAAATLSLSAGCASTSSLPAWCRTPGWMHRGTAATADSDESAVASSRSRRKSSLNEELSPEFKEAQKTFKNTEKTLLAWARYQEDIGEYAEARKMYRELQVAYPKNLEAHLGMARIELLTGRSEQAEKLLTDLKKTYPDNSAVRVELGRMYSQKEDWPKAVREFEDACDVEPEDQNCRYELGVALARAGQFDQALSHLTFAVGAPAANYNIGYILHEQGKDSDAAEWIHNALQLHPDQRTAEKSKAMLAKMQPSDANPSDAAAMAHHSASARGGFAASSPVNTPSRPSSTQQIAAQFSPAPVVTGRGGGHPVVTAGRAADGIPLPAAEPGQPIPERSQPGGNAGSQFHTVSHSETDTSGKAVYASSQPPQWNGPAPQPVNGPSNVAPAVSQDPPNWRARKE